MKKRVIRRNPLRLSSAAILWRAFVFQESFQLHESRFPFHRWIPVFKRKCFEDHELLRPKEQWSRHRTPPLPKKINILATRRHNGSNSLREPPSRMPLDWIRSPKQQKMEKKKAWTRSIRLKLIHTVKAFRSFLARSQCSYSTIKETQPDRMGSRSHCHTCSWTPKVTGLISVQAVGRSSSGIFLPLESWKMFSCLSSKRRWLRCLFHCLIKYPTRV